MSGMCGERCIYKARSIDRVFASAEVSKVCGVFDEPDDNGSIEWKEEYMTTRKDLVAKDRFSAVADGF